VKEAGGAEADVTAPFARLGACSPVFWLRREPLALERPPDRRLLGPGTATPPIYVRVETRAQ
jgi:hypothetical protein